jgi:predicted dehydrogenase
MCPSLDEKPSDWRNAFSVFGNDVTRRDFIKGSIAAGAVVGGGLGAFYFGYSSTLASPVRVGIIGTGDQGAVLIGALNPNFIQVKSVADLRSYNQWRAFHGDHYEAEPDSRPDPRPGLMAKYGWKTEDAARKKIAVYATYQDLLKAAKQDRIEAVIIALPLHLHAEAAVAALKAGLHVFTEKMMADTTYKCKEMARAAQTAKRVLAVGHQRRYNLLYAKAAESIASGTMGKLHYVRAQYHVPKLALPLLPGSKEMKQLVDDWQAKADAASGRELDVWSKRMAQVSQQAEDEILAEQNGYGSKSRKAIDELLRWRFYNALSQGLFAEVVSQQIDAANMFIAAAHEGTMQYPLNIVAAANRPMKGAPGDVADHISCILEYPAIDWEENDSIKSRKRIGVQCAVVNGNGYGGYGEIAYGERLAVILEKEKDWSVAKSSSGVKTSVKAGKGGGPTLDTQASAGGAATKAKGDYSRGYVEELEHWAWCIRHRSSENQSRANAEVGLANAVTALAAKESARQGHGKTVDFDPDWFNIDSDATLEGKKPDLKRYDS